MLCSTPQFGETRRRSEDVYFLVKKTMRSSAAAAIQRWREGKNDVVPTCLPVPVQPSAEAVRVHNLAHILFKPWCPICLVATGKASPHAGHKSQDQTVQTDWCFFKKSGGKTESMNQAWEATLTLVPVNTGWLQSCQRCGWCYARRVCGESRNRLRETHAPRDSDFANRQRASGSGLRQQSRSTEARTDACHSGAKALATNHGQRRGSHSIRRG